MVDRDLLTTKLAELHHRVQRVTASVPESAEALRADRDALDLVSFNLMLAVQVCADMASHSIADEGCPSRARWQQVSAASHSMVSSLARPLLQRSVTRVRVVRAVR